MKKLRIISAILTLVMLLSTFTVGANAAYADKIDEDGNPIINYVTTSYDSPSAKLADMVLMKEAYGYQLWYEEFTGEIALVDTASGQVIFSNPFDVASTSASTAVKQKLLSQIYLTYLENDVQKDMNSYVEAALRNQIVQKNIKNGIRIEYTLGEEQTTRLVPRLIEKSRFESMILSNIDNEFVNGKVAAFYTLQDPYDTSLTERQVAVMQSTFPITTEMAVYVCDPDIKARELRLLEDYIKQYCPLYTYEELDYDHDMTGYTGDDAAPPRFRMALEYTINEDGLEVRLPANGISFDEATYQFEQVEILPYFGAGNNKYTGYTFIPDGSGALIRFEDLVGTSYNVAGQVYGKDYAYHEVTGSNQEEWRTPVYGVITNYEETQTTSASDTAAATTTTDTTEEVDLGVELHDLNYSNGFLAIITEGDSMATLMSEHGGGTHPYNTVYAQFVPRPSDEYNLGDSISVSGNATWTVTSSRKYTGSYRIQYIMLTDPDVAEENGIDDYYETSYYGMAEAYRDYLTNTGVLTKFTEDDVQEDIPLVIETFGSIETVERYFSFPVTVDTPLTTFEDVKTMYNELSEAGVTNISFKLTGYANGGMQPTSPYKVKWVSAVGGKSGFTDLVQYAAENGFNVYPDFDFVYIHDTDMFDGISLRKHAIRTIDDRYTTKRTYNAATQSFQRSMAIAFSPVFYSYVYDHFNKQYSTYGNNSIAVSTLGTDLNTDFDEDEPYHREDDKGYTLDLLESISEDYENIMVEGGNAYAIQYADIITDMSLTSSKFVKASESVPFTGIVYHGSKVFTGPATNEEGDINEAILQAIESGAGMYFILSYENTAKLKEDDDLSKYYSVAYDIWKEDLVKYYTTLNEATKDLQTSYITGHEFLDGQRIPDDDEVAADALEAQLAAQEAQEAAELAAETEARAERLAARLAAQAGEVVEETAEETAEAAETTETTETTETAAADTTETTTDDGVKLDEFGEEIVEEEAEEEVDLDKYGTTSGSIVHVTYENGVEFILNYNSFDVTVNYNGTTYTIGGLQFVRLG